MLRTPVAVVAGITYNYMPFAALPLYVALERIDRRLVEAAKDLYATKSMAFRKVVLPLSVPGIFAAVILTFVPATGDYVNSTILGGPGHDDDRPDHPGLLPGATQYSIAAAMSVILMVGMLIIALIYAQALGTEDSTLAAGAAA